MNTFHSSGFGNRELIIYSDFMPSKIIHTSNCHNKSWRRFADSQSPRWADRSCPSKKRPSFGRWTLGNPVSPWSIGSGLRSLASSGQFPSWESHRGLWPPSRGSFAQILYFHFRLKVRRRSWRREVPVSAARGRPCQSRGQRSRIEWHCRLWGCSECCREKEFDRENDI